MRRRLIDSGHISSPLRAQQHAGLRGLLREIFVAKLLKNVLPPEVVVGSGQLISFAGQYSPQIDIILYAPSVMPPAVYDGIHGFFPTESCLYTVEVKTKLSRNELVSSINAARKIRSFQLLGTEHWTATATADTWLQSRKYGTPYPVCTLFAFSSDLRGGPEAELKRYRSVDEHADDDPAIRAICVRGVGYWYFGEKGWLFAPATKNYDEIIFFLAGISNTIPQLIIAKGKPRFGRYLTGDPEAFSQA